MRFVAEIHVSIEEVVSAWYHKIAQVKKDLIHAVTHHLSLAPHLSAHVEDSGMLDFIKGCFSLVDVRRSELEYDTASSRLNQSCERFRNSSFATMANDLLWLTLVREPLRYDDLSGASAILAGTAKSANDPLM